MQREIYHRIAAETAAGRAFAVATVVAVRGSASAKPGAKALISAEGQNLFGWVGGGCAEAFVKAQALEAIAEGRSRVVLADLDDEVFGLGMPCGGVMDVFIEPHVPPAVLKVSIPSPLVSAASFLAHGLGYELNAEESAGNADAGIATLLSNFATAVATQRGATGLPLAVVKDISHAPPLKRPPHSPLNPSALVLCGVSRITEELARLGAMLKWPVIVCGSAPEAANYPDGATLVRVEAGLRNVRIPADAAVVVAAHHKGDPEFLRLAIEAGAGYAGLVASPKRARLILEDLQDVERELPLSAPAGLDIGCRTPADIALSIVAEIIKVYSVHHAKDSAKDLSKDFTKGRTMLDTPISSPLVETSVSRRQFMQTAAIASVGLVIGFHLPGFGRFANIAEAAGAPAQKYPPNAFIRIAPDSTVTIIINKSEMGQGVYTSLAQIIAEELDCDWNKIKSESAPVAPVYAHTAFGMQMTGGSTAVTSSYDQHRMIGATGRALLVEAAAQEWKIPASQCRTENGFVIDTKSKKQLSYGELATKANALPEPKTVKLKDPKQFKLIGKPLRRLDAPSKVNGSAQFGLDVRLPGMLFAVIARSPSFGGKVKSFDAGAAKDVKGVVDVVQVPTGIAVLATSTWAAQQGRKALKIDWDAGAGGKLSSVELRKEFTALGDKPGTVARPGPGADMALQAAKQVVEARFDFPYLAHATMEPLNCTVDYDGKSCHIYTGTHMQTADAMTAAKVLGLDPKDVQLTTTLLGGSFGRRANPMSDFVMEAVTVAKVVKKPVQIVWTREDDMKGGYYRPMTHHHVKAGLDAKGNIVAWKHTIVSPSIIEGTPFAAFMIQNGVDVTTVEGVADSPYEMQNQHVDVHAPKLPVPVQWWRSVGHSHNGYVMEAMIDELAHAAKADPVAFRLKLLKKHPRHVAALKLAAEKAGWGKKLPAGQARGVAVHESFGSVVAHVVDASIVNGVPKIHRVVSGVHCGRVINPSGATAQIESGIVYGLSAALYGAITLKDGQVEQGNFDTYKVLMGSEMPKIEVHFVPSTDHPTGLGEPGVPPTAPALANALAVLTGKRTYALPMAGTATSS